MTLKIFCMLAVSIVQFGNCRIFKEVKNPKFRIAEFDVLIPERLITQEELEMYYSFKNIYPGTKWCGTGNIAENDDDLGSAREADKCCRAHDKCNDIIDSGTSNYNLTNDSSFTRLSCDCDEQFRKCLRSDDSNTASIIGYAYFNIIGTQCFRKEYKQIGCEEYSGGTNTKCIKYKYDTNSEKIYQWFDVTCPTSKTRFSK